jgi:hypothetical protein
MTVRLFEILLSKKRRGRARVIGSRKVSGPGSLGIQAATASGNKRVNYHIGKENY